MKFLPRSRSASKVDPAAEALAWALVGAPSRLTTVDAIELVCQATGWPVGHVWVPVDGRWRSSGVWYDADPETYGVLRDVTLAGDLGSGRGLVAAVLHLETVRFAADLVGVGSDTRRDVAVEAGLAGAVGLPVVEDGRVAAVVEFLTTTAVAPSSELVDALRDLAERTAVVAPRPTPIYAADLSSVGLLAELKRALRAQAVTAFAATG